jgi:hypothetical protein
MSYREQLENLTADKKGLVITKEVETVLFYNEIIKIDRVYYFY